MRRLRVALRLLSMAVLVVSTKAAGHALAADAPGTGGHTDVYLRQLIAAAEQRSLATRREWLALLHYKPAGGGVGRSTIDPASAFFLSAEGATDPHAELLATLTFVVEAVDRSDDEGSISCKRIARYRWLDSQLGFDRRRVPEPSCPALESWLQAINPGGVTLVFPEAYLNNPASMFGHTLLRIDSRHKWQGRDLLAYAVNFAADTGDDGGVAFAYKGIFGFYPGAFSVMPYYEKLRQYGDWENRDIWEYRLTLTPSETRRLLEHVWELRGVTFPYYFLSENCSYELLGLLEVARPGLRLRESFRWWVIPVDTVRAVVGEPGLVAEASYRPSPATRIRRQVEGLDPISRRAAWRLGTLRASPRSPALSGVPDARRARVWNLAYDYLRYRYLAGDLTREASLGPARRMLAELARAPAGEPVPTVPRPRVRPDQGHPSARVTLKGGWRDGEPYVEARLRPVFHELLDPTGGYSEGAQIVLLEPALRWLPERRRLRLEELVAIDVTSITPRDGFLQPISWKASTGLRTRLVPSADGELNPKLVWSGGAGAGVASKPARSLLAYGFVEMTADAGDPLERGFAVGPALQVGLLAGPDDDRWRVGLSATQTRFAWGDATSETRIALDGRLSTGDRSAVEVEVAFHRDFDHEWMDAGLAWKLFFGRGGGDGPGAAAAARLPASQGADARVE